MRQHWRERILIGSAVIAAVGLMIFGPISQDLAYHDFADQRAFFGIPNFMDVVSNFPFVVFGLAGFGLCIRNRPKEGCWSWLVFFAGVTLVGVGSAYYHVRPDNDSLVWDRLPMTIGFMGLFIALLSERIHPRIERRLLIPAMALGIASVALWQYSDDLRLYAWVQYFPMVAIPYVALVYRSRYNHQRFLLFAFILYALSKIFEASDAEIFRLSSELLSGHSLKHLAAALAAYSLYLMLKKRCIAA